MALSTGPEDLQPEACLAVIVVKLERRRVDCFAGSCVQADAVVANIHQLNEAALERFPRWHFGLVVIDEGHHCEATSWQLVRVRDSRKYRAGSVGPRARLRVLRAAGQGLGA